MDGPRWVSKEMVALELEVSPSTLHSKSKNGEVEVAARETPG